MIRYHRLTFDSVADGALRSTYLPWIESITHIKAGEEEELELRLYSNYENVWRMLKQRLDEPDVRLKANTPPAFTNGQSSTGWLDTNE